MIAKRYTFSKSSAIIPTGEIMKQFQRLIILFLVIPTVSCLTLASAAYKDRSVKTGDPSTATYDGSMYRLSVECNQPNALIFLNGSLYGQTDANGYFSIKLRSGAYDMKIAKENHRPYSRNIRLDRDRMIRFGMQKTVGNGNGESK